jgi:hypothetical protein
MRKDGVNLSDYGLGKGAPTSASVLRHSGIMAGSVLEKICEQYANHWFIQSEVEWIISLGRMLI